MKVFYCIYQDDEDTDGDNLKTLNRVELQLLIDRMLQQAENYVGLVDDFKTTIQFLFNIDGTVLVDIPDIEKEGSYSKNISISEFKLLIANLQEPYSKYITELNLEFTSFNEEDWIDE